MKTLYAIVKLSVDVVDNTSLDDIAERIGSECDYSFSYEDDICRIARTELLKVTPLPKSSPDDDVEDWDEPGWASEHEQ